MARGPKRGHQETPGEQGGSAINITDARYAEAAEALWYREEVYLRGSTWKLERTPVNGRWFISRDGHRTNTEWRDEDPTPESLEKALRRIVT